MATVSFDEKVVVTDPKVISMIKEDLDSTTPIVHKQNIICTINSTEENGKKWATKLLHKSNI